MTNSEEIELKLDVSPERAADVAKAPELANVRPRRRRQLTVYYDTPGQHLREAGLSLRVRRIGSKRIQTFKAEAAGTAGLFAREEWEQEIAGDEPVLDGATGGLARLLARIDIADLQPTFRSKVSRTIWEVAFGDARIEVAFDRGEVSAAGRSDPICEVELELRAGEPAALFAFAGALASGVPLRLGVLTKSQRGYRLLNGGAAGAVKAMPIALDTDATAAEAFQAIARACLRQYRLNETLLLESRGAKPLHKARVALRRLRSALSIFRPMLADERFDHLRGELRWLAAELGEARNLDVLLARAGKTPHAGILRAARERSYDAVAAALSSARSMQLMLALAEWVATGPWLTDPAREKLRRRSAESYAGELLDRYRRRIKRQSKHLARIDDEARHQLRIEAKKLRYSAEFFAALYGKKRAARRRKTFLAALEALQSHLGDLNDHATGRSLLLDLGLTDDAAASLLDAGIDREGLLAGAGDARDALVNSKRFWR